MPDRPGPPPLRPDAAFGFAGGVYWFDGIFEGPAGDAADLREQIPRLAALGLATADVEIEAGRFSLLAADHRRPIEGDAGLELEELRDALEALLRSSPRPQDCESTIRLTEVGAGRARETLFAVHGGVVQRLSRERPLRPEDGRRALAQPPGGPRPEVSGRRRLLIGGALVVAALVFGWQAGLLDALLAPAAKELTVDPGDFAGLLELEIEAQPLAYGFVIRRGPAFPATPAEARSAREQAVDLISAKAITIAAEGDLVYVLIVDQEGRTIGGRGLSLRPLLEGEMAEVRGSLPARRGARELRLALDLGSGHKGM
ncbi:MAG: hypothetical protein H6807_08930 [Planctomycetes bacterium]|nr:hypothetical protein [Planctomycetota bacterium]